MDAQPASKQLYRATAALIAVLALLLAGAIQINETPENEPKSHVDIAAELALEIPGPGCLQWQNAAEEHSLWLLQICSK